MYLSPVYVPSAKRKLGCDPCGLLRHRSLACDEVLHDFELDQPNFGQPLPLPVDQMVELPIQMPDLELGLD